MGTKILLVDDSLTMLKILKKSAQMVIKDVEIFEAENGQQALDILEQNSDIVLILLDVNMPVMNGMEFLKTMREDDRFKDIKVIMQTTECGDEQIKKILALGVSGYLIKPYQTKVAQELMVKMASTVGYELK